MATLTLDYDAKNSFAVSFIETMKKSGVFKIVEKDGSPYDEEFVKKIQRSRQSKGKSIKTEDLWK